MLAAIAERVKNRGMTAGAEVTLVTSPRAATPQGVFSPSRNAQRGNAEEGMSNVIIKIAMYLSERIRLTMPSERAQEAYVRPKVYSCHRVCTL